MLKISYYTACSLYLSVHAMLGEACKIFIVMGIGMPYCLGSIIILQQDKNAKYVLRCLKNNELAT